MQKPRSWCTKTYLKKVKSTEILVKRKSVDAALRAAAPCAAKVAVVADFVVGTPNRELAIATPGGVEKVQGSPKQRRYRSVRRIDF